MCFIVCLVTSAVLAVITCLLSLRDWPRHTSHVSRAKHAAELSLFEDGRRFGTADPVMKHDVPSRALATTSSCSSLSFAFDLRILASILCNCDAPSEPMRCVSSLFAPSGRFFSAPRRMRSATETLAFFLRGGRILWVNLSILVEHCGARGVAVSICCSAASGVICAAQRVLVAAAAARSVSRATNNACAGLTGRALRWRSAGALND